MYLFLCYPKCSTCRKAQKHLDKLNVNYEYRDIMTNNPTKDELRLWLKQSNLPIQKLFNTSGIMYRELNLKEKLPKLTDDEKLELLASSGRLIKRPLLIGTDVVIVGYNENNYMEKLK